jgi:hypothetical protein
MIRIPRSLPALSLLAASSCWLWLLIQTACRSEEKQSEKINQTSQDKAQKVSISPQACRPCHQAIVDSFLLTGKGRSLQAATHSADFANWTRPAPVYDRHRDLHYLPEKTSKEFYILEYRLADSDTVHLRREKVSQVIGSGNQTVSFFREENGYLYEMPLTWYRKKAIWDLSPGYENGGNYGFEREIGTECLECHASGYEPVPHSLNRYSSSGFALTCSACHGEVDSHLSHMKMGKGGKEDKIVQIKKLEPQIQMDVCRQCHLEGIKVKKDKSPAGAFSPGKRFSDYYEIFIEGSGNQDFGFASHSERLQMSRCFVQSGGRLTCTGCHDPHARLPADSKSFFNGKCMSCHEENSPQTVCRVAKGEKSNCISCHLRKSGTSDIPHVNSTDHWIRKKPAETKQESGIGELKYFAGRQFSRRELGLARLHQAETSGDRKKIEDVKQFLTEFKPEEKLRLQYLLGKPGLPETDTSKFQSIQDPMLRFQWAEVKKRSRLPWYSDLEIASGQAPDRIELLYRKALADEETGRKPDYQGILRRNALHPEANLNLGFEELQAGNYEKAVFFLKNALKGNPDKILARENLARCYLESGRFSDAKKELNLLIKLKPDEIRYKQALSSIP